MSSDAYHMTSPPENGAGAALAMENAIRDAGITPAQIGYVNAHGTSTPAGDKAEAQAVKSIFGESASRVMVSSTKSMTGHLLGAAGAVESIYSILALRDQAVPPTINLDNPDEGCDLDFVPHEARQVSGMEYTLCNSFGFGGTNGSLIFKRSEPDCTMTIKKGPLVGPFIKRNPLVRLKTSCQTEPHASGDIMFLINGLEQENLPASDRATQFGDGCFTTARIIDGQVCLLDAHIRRLQTACETLMIPFQHWDTLRREMSQLVSEKSSGVLKVIISRGSVGRGYSGASCENPTRILSVSAYPAQYESWRKDGVTLTLSPIRLGRNPMLAGIKHLNRLEQVLIRTHLEQTDADEALVLDSEGFITECCAANLLWRKGRDVFTPSLEQAGVKGIMRQFCLQQLAHSGFRVVEVNEREEALLTADEVIVCNALMPVLPVRAYGQQVWSSRELFQFLVPLCEQTR